MFKTKLHRNATPHTLAAARILILSAWLIRILSEPIQNIGYLDSALFYPQGIMNVIPFSLIAWITSPTTLWGLKIISLVVIGLTLIGFQRKVFFPLSLMILIVGIGYLKGFGGHVNHRELTLLYCTILMYWLPVFEVWCVQPSKPDGADPKRYQSAMLVLCSVVIVQYVFVAIARIAMGTPDVFKPETIWGWILNRSMRMNPSEFSVGLDVLTHPWLKYSVAFAIFFSTILELSSVALLFCHRYLKWLILFSLVMLHASIYFMMNISFLENILCLLLFLDLTQIVPKVRPQKRS